MNRIRYLGKYHPPKPQQVVVLPSGAKWLPKPLRGASVRVEVVTHSADGVYAYIRARPIEPAGRIQVITWRQNNLTHPRTHEPIQATP